MGSKKVVGKKPQVKRGLTAQEIAFKEEVYEGQVGAAVGTYDSTFDIKAKAERATREALIALGAARRAAETAEQVYQHAQEQVALCQREQRELAETLSKISK